MKPSEIFEGENSSLKKTFDEAVKKHTPDIVEEIREKNQIESEMAVFFDTIAKNLPNNVERAALGDEKIFNAIKIAYPKIREFIYQQGFKDGEKKVLDEIEHEQQKLTDGFGHPKDCQQCEALKDK